MLNKIFHGDCVNILGKLDLESVDLIYLDPPFFTGKVFNGTKPKTQNYTFDDTWLNDSEYANFLYVRLSNCFNLLKNTGSIIVHCDRNSVHIIRFILDQINIKTFYSIQKPINLSGIPSLWITVLVQI